MPYKDLYIPKGQDIVIANIPSIELRPPIGPARIKSFLNSVNLKCHNLDLNLDLWHRLRKDKEYFQSDEDRFWEGSDKWQLWQDPKLFEDFYDVTLEKIVEETLTTKFSERQGRLIDNDASSSMEDKKKEGSFY